MYRLFVGLCRMAVPTGMEVKPSRASVGIWEGGGAVGLRSWTSVDDEDDGEEGDMGKRVHRGSCPISQSNNYTRNAWGEWD